MDKDGSKLLDIICALGLGPIWKSNDVFFYPDLFFLLFIQSNLFPISLFTNHSKTKG